MPRLGLSLVTGFSKNPLEHSGKSFELGGLGTVNWGVDKGRKHVTE